MRRGKIEILEADYIGSIEEKNLIEVEEGFVYRDSQENAYFIQNVDSVIAVYLQCEGNA